MPEPSEPQPSREGAIARPHRGTLTRHLVLLFVSFSIVPLLASNLWGYLQSERLLEDAAFRDVANMARVAALQVDAFVLDKTQALALLVDETRPTVALGSRPGRPPSELSSARAELEASLRRAAGADPDLEAIILLDPEGRVIAASDPAGAAEGWSLSACGGRTLAEARALGFEYRDADEPSLLLAAPIRGEAGELLAIACSRYGFDVHHELVSTQEQHAMKAALLVLDEAGRVVCSSFPDFAAGGDTPARASQHGHDSGTSGRDDAQLTPGAPAQALQAGLAPGSIWQGRYESVAHEEVIAAYQPVADVSWGVLVEVPVHRALERLEKLKEQAFALSGLLVALLVGAILVTARSITRPLRRLSAAARRIATGGLGERVQPEGPLEVADLAATFNQMSVALHLSQHRLEERIAERTQELEVSRKFAEQVLDSIEVLVVVVDRDLQIIKANQAALAFYGADIVSRRYDDVFGPAQRSGEGCPVRQTFETGESAAFERYWPWPEGREILAAEVYPVQPPGGAIDSVIELARVVTTEKQIQAQMVHHEKMAAFGLLAAGVAHEVGNPLAAIQSQLRMARLDLEPTRVAETLDVVDKQVGRIGRLVRDLVDMSRRKRDDVVLVSPGQVVDDVVRLLSHDPRAHNVEVSNDLPADLPGVRLKEDDLLQVLLNLGINGLDVMTHGGRLSFAAGVHDGAVVLRVIDTGPGIGHEVRQRIFEPFFTTKSPGRGTGLGLFVSRNIVEANGGRLELERTGSEGTVFAVQLAADAAVSARGVR